MEKVAEKSEKYAEIMRESAEKNQKSAEIRWKLAKSKRSAGWFCN
ncbi:hypothetical protein [Bacillus sp. USDA818B3_A]|nr:hypothetical protein [Bacillus sp. USDA818B3_A]